MSFLRPGAHVHMIGIAGTGMAALAGMLKAGGYRVTGSDANIYPPMSTMLASLDIPVKTPFSARNLLPEGEPRPDLVIIGNAMSRGNAEVEEVLDQGIRYESMAVAVARLCLDDRRSLVVAGTHGKTTTTSLLAWILEVAQFTPGFMIGGKPENFPSGFRAQPEPQGFFVIEGDEYDTAFFDKGPKFMHYVPRSIVLTSVEFDHADIYADLESIKTAFRRLVNLVPAGGLIVAAGDNVNVDDCLKKAYSPIERYGFSPNCRWRAENIETMEEWTRFEIFRGSERFLRAELKMSGEHNVLNALAAVAMAAHYGVPEKALRQALGTFKGVKRRLEVRGEVNGITVIDDFAHHPTAIRETLRAVKARFPHRKIWAILEPRSNTLRRRVLEDQLIDALSLADRATLAGVYQSAAIPEKERLDPGRMIPRLLREGVQASMFNTTDEIVRYVASQARKHDVLVVMSNGGFDGIHDKLLARLAEPA